MTRLASPKTMESDDMWYSGHHVRSSSQRVYLCLPESEVYARWDETEGPGSSARFVVKYSAGLGGFIARGETPERLQRLTRRMFERQWRELCRSGALPQPAYKLLSLEPVDPSSLIAEEAEQLGIDFDRIESYVVFCAEYDEAPCCIPLGNFDRLRHARFCARESSAAARFIVRQLNDHPCFWEETDERADERCMVDAEFSFCDSSARLIPSELTRFEARQCLAPGMGGALEAYTKDILGRKAGDVVEKRCFVDTGIVVSGIKSRHDADKFLRDMERVAFSGEDRALGQRDFRSSDFKISETGRVSIKRSYRIKVLRVLRLAQGIDPAVFDAREEGAGPHARFAEDPRSIKTMSDVAKFVARAGNNAAGGVRDTSGFVDLAAAPPPGVASDGLDAGGDKPNGGMPNPRGGLAAFWSKAMKVLGAGFFPRGGRRRFGDLWSARPFAAQSEQENYMDEIFGSWQMRQTRNLRLQKLEEIKINRWGEGVNFELIGQFAEFMTDTVIDSMNFEFEMRLLDDAFVFAFPASAEKGIRQWVSDRCARGLGVGEGRTVKEICERARRDGVFRAGMEAAYNEDMRVCAKLDYLWSIGAAGLSKEDFVEMAGYRYDSSWMFRKRTDPERPKAAIEEDPLFFRSSGRKPAGKGKRGGGGNRSAGMGGWAEFLAHGVNFAELGIEGYEEALARSRSKQNETPISQSLSQRPCPKEGQNADAAEVAEGGQAGQGAKAHAASEKAAAKQDEELARSPKARLCEWLAASGAGTREISIESTRAMALWQMRGDARFVDFLDLVYLYNPKRMFGCLSPFESDGRKVGRSKF